MRLISSNFAISKISIIESLPAGEVQTGTQLAGYIEGLGLDDGPGIELRRAVSGSELIAHLLDLEVEARAGALPMIHFEMHGTWDGRGLVTANLDVVAWSRIAEILLRINLSTRFNLVAFVAACNGGYFLEEMRLIAPTPCYALVAPTDEVDASEVMRAARDFYRTLLTTSDAAKAVSIIMNQRVQQGQWFAQWAENWYRMVVLNYVRTHCSPKALKERAREMNARARAEGLSIGMAQLKQQLRASTRVDLVGKYFDCFFSTEKIPENARRFAYLREQMSAEIAEILANPQTVKEL